jgi:hypothetical protein
MSYCEWYYVSHGGIVGGSGNIRDNANGGFVDGFVKIKRWDF